MTDLDGDPSERTLVMNIPNRGVEGGAFRGDIAPWFGALIWRHAGKDTSEARSIRTGQISPVHRAILLRGLREGYRLEKLHTPGWSEPTLRPGTPVITGVAIARSRSTKRRMTDGRG